MSDPRHLRVIVCGGRHFADGACVQQVLDRVRAAVPADYRLVIVHGAATGADTLARQWAESKGIAHEAHAADWALGRGAGRMRNERMLSLGCELVVAFPGGRGTAHMCAIARRNSVRVLEVGAPLNAPYIGAARTRA